MKRTQSVCAGAVALAVIFISSGLATSAVENADPNLVGWWKLDDGAGTTAVDSSGRGNNGTLTGDPVWGQGRIHGGLTFNGTTSYVDCSGGTGLDVRNALSLTMWVKTADAATGARHAYVTKGEFTYGMRHTDANSVEFYIFSGGFQYARMPVTAAFNGTWHHLVGTYDGGAVRLYVDGQVQATTPCTGLINKDTNYRFNMGWNDQGDSANRWWYQGALDDVRVYDRALSNQEIQKLLQPDLSSMPVPGDRAKDVWPDVILHWTAGVTATGHDVYLGAQLDDVTQATRANPRGVLVTMGQAEPSYDPAGLLALDRTYYWRVDEVGDAPNAGPFKGEVWRFTVPLAFPVKQVTATASSSNKANTGPETTVNGSGLDAADLHSTDSATMWLSSATAPKPMWIQYEFDKAYKLHEMWVWNYNAATESVLGFGIKDATLEYSANGIAWTSFGDVQFARATSKAGYAHNTTVDFKDLLVKAVRITAKNTWGNRAQCGLSEVRFLSIPIHASEPQPAAGGTASGLDVVLTWRPGREAVSHEVCVSGDANAVAAGSALAAKVVENRYDCTGLDLRYATTYYWKINEVNEASSTPIAQGDVWSFSTPQDSVVDDFEAYDDACKRVFFAWVDGFGYSGSTDCGVPSSNGNATGSTVGNLNPPFAEGTIIRSGSQSMPVSFDNSKAPFYSEAVREWASPQSWTRGGVDTLTLYVRGDPPGFLETGPGTILMNGTGTDIFNAADEGRFVYRQLTGDGSITARIDSLANTNAWAKAGVMIRETLDAGSSWAYVLMSIANGAHFQARLGTNVTSATDTSVTLPASQTTLAVPGWVRIERKGNQFNGYFKSDAAGATWTAMVWNPQTIAMGATVYIGLAVTSHAANVVCAAGLSGISTTGTVTGAWQTADLGIAQVAGNLPETFYVVVQDNAGKAAVVSHPNPSVITTGAWEQWDIPFSQITSAGTSLGSVKKVAIGIGSRTAPKAGAAGKVFIDDILLRRIASP